MVNLVISFESEGVRCWRRANRISRSSSSTTAPPMILRARSKNLPIRASSSSGRTTAAAARRATPASTWRADVLSPSWIPTTSSCPHHLATMRKLLENAPGTAGYARIVVDRGEGRTFLKPPRAIREGEDMATYLLCDRGFIPTSTIVVERKMAEAVRFHENLAAAEDTDFAIRLTLAGHRFVMAKEPGVHWNDSFDPNRLSAGRKSATMRRWIEDLRPKIPAKAYYGCLGWAYAKHVAMKNPLAALKLYLAALVRGCYRPSLAGIVFLQIFLSDRVYRRLADTAIAWFGAGLRPGSAP